MSLSSDIALLAQVPLFEGLNEEQLRLIAFGTEKRRISQGQVLFKEQSPAECAYLVTSGHIMLSSAATGPQSIKEFVVREGALLSELALFTLCERKFTAIAIEDSEVLRITRIIFHRLLEEYPQIGPIVIKRIQDNIAALADGATSLQHHFSL